MIKIKEILNPDLGKAFQRISIALRQYSPEKIEWVNHNNADLFILHTVGGKEYDKFYTLPINKTINIQHCYFTTAVTPEQWFRLWKDAKLNISFHDLQSYTIDKIEFLKVPWGADPNIFKYNHYIKNIKVFTTGHVAATEALDLVHSACEKTNNIMYHTGANLKYPPLHYKYLNYMPDDMLGAYLNRAQYISCLRWIEGFEMMGIEGAMCGATPIIFDLPTYSYYKGFGYFINSTDNVEKQLAELFLSEYKPLSEEQIEYVRKNFDWKVIVESIFKRIME